MNVRYYRGTDSFYIEFRPAPGTATREVVGGLNVDLDTSGEVVGFEITHASKRLDLSTLDESLPRELTRLSKRLHKRLGELKQAANEPLPEDPAPVPPPNEKARELRTVSAACRAVDTARRLSLNPPTASPGGGPGCGWWGVEGLGLVGFGGFRGCGGCGLVG